MKLLKQLESGFKRTINWNEYQSKLTEQTQNRHLNYLIDPSFQGVNELFVLSFVNKNFRKVQRGYFLPKVEIKNYNVLIDGKNFFDQPIKHDKITWEHWKNCNWSRRDDYTNGCLLDYIYFKENYKLIAIDLTKQQKLDADSKAIQYINFTGNLERDENTQFFFIIEEAKETVLNLKGTVKVLWFYFVLIY